MFANYRPPTIKQIVDSTLGLPAYKADAQLGVWARQLVTETLNELFVTEHEEAKWSTGELFPINSSLSSGATEYSYTEVERTGRAKIVADNATDLPRANLTGKQHTLPVKTLGISLEFSDQEVRTSGMHGLMDTPSEKASAAREGHDFTLSDYIREGVAGMGLHGATNAPGIIVQQAITGAWATATAAQIVADFTAAANTPIETSNGVEVPNCAVFPVSAFTRISTLKNSTSSDITVLQYLKQAFPQITTWTWDAGMSTAAADGSAAVQIYKKDPTRGRAVMPMTLEAKAPERHGFVTVINFESRFGGVMYPKPRSSLRLEGI